MKFLKNRHSNLVRLMSVMFQQLRCSLTQTCRYCFGTVVGNLSMYGASPRNFCTCNRESKSSKVLIFPGICSAFNNMLCLKQASTKRLTKRITEVSLEEILLIISTTAILSE